MSKLFRKLPPDEAREVRAAALAKLVRRIGAARQAGDEGEAVRLQGVHDELVRLANA